MEKKSFDEIITIRNMDYTIEGDCLFRILDDGSKHKLGWVINNGRGDALAVNIEPIKEKWMEECIENGIPSHEPNEPIPFWDDGIDIKRAFKEFYETYTT
jgi:hypothetical protein